MTAAVAAIAVVDDVAIVLLVAAIFADIHATACHNVFAIVPIVFGAGAVIAMTMSFPYRVVAYLVGRGSQVEVLA